MGLSSLPFHAALQTARLPKETIRLSGFILRKGGREDFFFFGSGIIFVVITELQKSKDQFFR